MGEFDQLVAVVTGAGSGIGAAVASVLAHRGARVAGLDLAPATVRPPAVPFGCDIADEASAAPAVADVVRQLGRIDVLVNCAAIGAVGTVEQATDDEWSRVLSVNVVGTARMCRLVLPHLRHSPAPAIVNICSIVATAGLPDRAVYSASKGAVLALTRAMAADLVGAGIRVTSVSPGTADTPWVARLLEAAEDPAAERRALEARQPLGRLVTADEVAHAVAYLASPSAGATTGTDLAVDGGVSGLRVRPKAPSA